MRVVSSPLLPSVLLLVAAAAKHSRQTSIISTTALPPNCKRTSDRNYSHCCVNSQHLIHKYLLAISLARAMSVTRYDDAIGRIPVRQLFARIGLGCVVVANSLSSEPTICDRLCVSEHGHESSVANKLRDTLPVRFCNVFKSKWERSDLANMDDLFATLAENLGKA